MTMQVPLMFSRHDLLAATQIVHMAQQTPSTSAQCNHSSHNFLSSTTAAAAANSNQILRTHQADNNRHSCMVYMYVIRLAIQGCPAAATTLLPDHCIASTTQ